MPLEIYQIDAFADEIFQGNPAAVCPLDSWLDEGVMQSIAAENNVSETAFFVAEGEGYRLRWFTPFQEVEFCGHATLASAYVIFYFLEKARAEIIFDTRRGRFFVEKDEDALLMNLPAEPSAPCALPKGLAESLGAKPQETHKGANLMAVFDNDKVIEALKPNMQTLAELCEREGGVGIIATAPAPKDAPYDFVSRFFAPAHGIPEDPATGSAHCLMAPYWAKRLGKEKLRAQQLSQRGAKILMQIQKDRVLMKGACRLYMKGKIYL